MSAEEKAGLGFYAIVVFLFVSIVVHGLIAQRNERELNMKLITCEVKDVSI